MPEEALLIVVASASLNSARASSVNILVRQEARDLGPTLRELGTKRQWRGSIGVRERLEEGIVGNTLLRRIAPTRRDEEAALASRQRHLLRQPGLADPWLSHQEHQAPCAVLHGIERREQNRALLVASDELVLWPRAEKASEWQRRLLARAGVRAGRHLG